MTDLPMTPRRMHDDVAPTVLAGLVYFGLVFAAGFVFGALRVPLVEPRVGKLVATLIEAPVLICVMVVAARSVTAWFDLSGHRLALASAGFIALSLVFLADFSVGLLLRQMSFGEQWLYLLTPAGLTYLLLLAVFAATPLLCDLWQRRQ